MGYVSVKGGLEAIENAKELVEFYRIKDATEPLEIKQIQSQLRLAIDKIMGEGSLYAPEYAALALKQMEGDVLEAAFVLRAFRATLQRRYYSEIVSTREMFVKRKISSSFREIPGGQVLGPTRDYIQRMLDTTKYKEDSTALEGFLEYFDHKVEKEKLESAKIYGKVIDLLRSEGLLMPVDDDPDKTVKDVTREAVKFPAPRSVTLQMLARAETGGLMAMAYSSMRGFGNVHGTIGELRFGSVRVHIKDPLGRKRYIGSIQVTECEMITKVKAAKKTKVPYFAIGYGLVFGQNENKAICMSILDRAIRNKDDSSPSNNQEFVLYHTEGVEALGFTNHLKLPHYVTFQSGLSNLREAVKRNALDQEEKSKYYEAMHDKRKKEKVNG
jgi:alpha-D-ribose 1-methylphosphonate 5-triphosphate synthase subunit PhnI